ncbi:hypothetical protein [Maribacter sp. Asnod2-G09]|uniref:hypothetical protein n=1 Tax=Maribacter sp. Asnod2-G09 TaxID=3160577 RepID=UPI0038631BEA
MKSVIWIVLVITTFISQPSINEQQIPASQTNTTKQDAYSVLNTKCNFCHSVKKNRTVFSLENMDNLAKAIEYQVFIKKKMPKGRKNNLSSLEKEKLLKWISSLDKT